MFTENMYLKIRNIVEKCINYNLDVFMVYFLMCFYALFLIFKNEVLTYSFYANHLYIFLFILSNTLLLSSIYLLNKISDKVEDILNNTQVSAKRKNIFFIYLILSFVSLLGYVLSAPSFVFFYLTFFSLGFFYSFPVKYKLKQYLILKNIIPSFCWFLSIMLIVKFQFPQMEILQICKEHISLFFAIFLFGIIWDLPDAKGDELAGISTIPVVLGFKNTKLLLIISNTLLIFFLKSFKSIVMVILLLAFLTLMKQKTKKSTYHLAILGYSILLILFTFVS